MKKSPYLCKTNKKTFFELYMGKYQSGQMGLRCNVIDF